MEKKCKICGTINEENRNFCKNCFQQLEETQMVKSNDIILEPIKDNDVNTNSKIDLKPIEENNYKITSLEPIDEEIKKDNIENIDIEENNMSEIEESQNIKLEQIKEDTTIDKKEEPDKEENIHSKRIEDDEEEIETPDKIERVKHIKRTRSKECKECDSNLKIIFKFLILFILFSILGYFLVSGIYIAIAYIFKINALENNLITYVVTLVQNILVIFLTVVITFRKTIPSEKNSIKLINAIYILFVLIWVIEIIIYNICVLKVYLLASTLIPITLVLIYGQILYNLMKYVINKKSSYEIKKDKNNNIIMVLITLLFILFSAYSINKKVELDFLKEPIPEHIEMTDEQYVEAFISTVEKNILELKLEDSNYQIPSVVNDINMAGYFGEYPEEIELNINENGIVTSGKVVYNIVVYNYDGNKIVKE